MIPGWILLGHQWVPVVSFRWYFGFEAHRDVCACDAEFGEDLDLVVFVVAMERSSTFFAVFLATLLVVGFVGRLEAEKFSEEDLTELDLTEEERAVLRLQQEESDDDLDYNPLGKKSKGPEEEDVVILIPDEFAGFVKSNQYVLLEFYAPWCGHCNKLAPEFAKAATELKETDVVLAKMDAVEHGDFAADHDVRAYPTLFFFIDGVKVPYTGGRSR